MNKITIVRGVLGGHPDLAYSPAGAAYCRFTVCVSQRYDLDTGGWVEPPREQQRVVAFYRLAVNIGYSLYHAHAVIVAGELATETYQRDDATTIHRHELIAAHVGLDLRFAQADVTRTPDLVSRANLRHRD